MIVSSWALFLNLAIVYEAKGFWVGALGLVLAPVTFVVVPWYAWIVLDNGLPLLVGYGSVLVGLSCARMMFTSFERRL